MGSKTLQTCSSELYSTLTSNQLLDCAISNTTPKYFKFHNLPKFQTLYQLGYVFLSYDIPTLPLQTVLEQFQMAATCFSEKVAIMRLLM
jgi:hypothetical protein